MTRVGIMTRDFIGTGIDRVVEYQAKVLAECGYDVTILGLNGNLTSPTNVGLRYLGPRLGFIEERILFATLPLNVPIALGQLPRYSDFEVLIAHFYPMTWLANLAQRLRGVKYVLYNHGILDSSSSGQPWIERAYLKSTSLLYAGTIGNPDLAISNSYYSKWQLERLVCLASRVIYNPVDLHLFNPAVDDSKIRRELSLGHSPVLLFVGILEPRKGVHHMLEVLRLTMRELPDTKLVIVGKTRYRQYYEMLLSKVTSSVRITGRVPSSQLPFYFAACDVYTTASSWESFNLPLAEAQACAKPAVAFDLPVHRELIETGKTGFLVPPGDIRGFADKIVLLLKNGDSRRNMGKNARINAERKFDLSQFAEQTRSALRSLMTES
jgi:glycosyltransferase involved in cell wall biosynthesis